MKIEVYLDDKTFRRFSIFDTFKRRKMWRSPVTFASILSICACICYYMDHVDGAFMLGTVLLIVGLGMPLTYFLNYFLSLNKQISVLKLKTPKLVYTLNLTPRTDGISVDNGKEHADYPWKKVHHAYRDKNATYLFITAGRAFLLPHNCVEEGPEELWKLLEKKLSEDQRTDLRRRK